MSGIIKLPDAGANSTAVLRQTTGQILEKMAEQDRVKDDLSDLWASAKDAGIDVKALRVVIAEMRDGEKLAAHLMGEAIVDRYRTQLGLTGDEGDPATAKARAIAEYLRTVKGINVKAGI